MRRRVAGLLTRLIVPGLLAALACGRSAPSAPTVSPTPLAPTLEAASSQPAPTATRVSEATPTAASTATPTVAPTATPDPFPNPRLEIAGEPEVVFDWSSQHCEPENIPDLAARAFRDAEGQVHLVLSHYVNYQMIGPSLDALAMDCRPVLVSAFDRDPAQFNDAAWLASPYTEDGRTVYALAHNEYRGHTHAGQCPSGDYFDCLDTSLTLVVSTDGGATYAPAAPPPGHLVATLPFAYLAGTGPSGLRTPSNLVRAADGYYYAFANVSAYRTQAQSVCAMRTDNLGDPRAWRFWDGAAFSGQFLDPYLNPEAPPAPHLCARLQLDNLGASLNDSLIYSTYFNRYVLVGLSADHIDGREVWGFYYSFSDDLLNWTRRQLLAEMPLPWTVSNSGSDVSVLYPALLDSASASMNFETMGQTAHLYYTVHNFGQGSLDRDLVRVPVRLAHD